MDERNWYYFDASTQYGPVSQQTIIELLENRTLSPTTMLWVEGMYDWRPADELFEIGGVAAPPAPPGGLPQQAVAIKKTPVILTILFAFIPLRDLVLAVQDQQTDLA